MHTPPAGVPTSLIPAASSVHAERHIRDRLPAPNSTPASQQLVVAPNRTRQLSSGENPVIHRSFSRWKPPSSLAVDDFYESTSSHAVSPVGFPRVNATIQAHEMDIDRRVMVASSQTGDWELDARFLHELSTWNRNNPENTLTHVLKKVDSAIKSSESFIDLIPDSPFPAQTLVKSLAKILQLGAKITTAKQKLQEFAVEVVEWITDFQELAFLSGGFRDQVWENLSRSRQVVDEISRWAVARLADGRWSLSKLDVEKEIAEFQNLVDEARQIFRDRSLITVMSGISHSLDALEKIQSMYMAHEVKIAAHKAHLQLLRRTLDHHTISRPTYDQQEKPLCAHGTRIQILETIRAWIYDQTFSSRNFLWLTGEPGSGKSAIAATIAQEAKDARFLWAQFFINHNIEETTNPNKYFPTIARQMAEKSEIIEELVHDRIQELPSVVDQISWVQASNLFISPIFKASCIDPQKPVLIVIDGLDETDRSRIHETAEIFSNLFETLFHCPNAKILISSRAIDEIHDCFSAGLIQQHIDHIHLDTAASIGEVGVYLRGKLHDIASKYKFDPSKWPGDQYLDQLEEKASGLFIWATTVTKFLDARLRIRGKQGCYHLLDNLNFSGTADINMLYGHILEITYDGDSGADDWDLETFRRLMGAIVVIREALNLTHLSNLLDLRLDPHGEAVDVQNFVRNLRTVLVQGVEELNDATVTQVHQTFFDYITSRSAPEKFRVDIESANAEMTICCLRHLAAAYTDVQKAHFPSTPSDINGFSIPTQYALKFCATHVPGKLGIVLDSSIETLSQFTSLLSRSSNSAQEGPLRISLHGGPRETMTTALYNHALFWNDVASPPTTPIDMLLGKERRKLVFSPDGSCLATAKHPRGLDLWDLRTLKIIHEEEKLDAYSLSFSPEGHKLAVACTDGIHIRDAHTLDQIGFIPDSQCQAVAFAPDSIHVVSGGVTGAIKIWNTVTNGLSYYPHLVQSHRERVGCIAVSPDGAWILSASRDCTLRLWDFFTGRAIGKPLVGHTYDIWSIAISTNSTYFASGSWDQTIRLWDPKTQQQLGSSWRGHSSAVNHVTFSGDTQHLLSCAKDGVRVWSVPSGETMSQFPLPNLIDSFFFNVAFSPDGEHIIYPTSSDNFSMVNIVPHSFHTKKAIEVQFNALSVPTGNLVISGSSVGDLFLTQLNSAMIGQAVTGNTQRLDSIAISPDEGYFAGVSFVHGNVHLWNASDQLLIGTYTLTSFMHGPPSLSFTRDGKTLVVTMGKQQLLLTPTKDGKLIPAHAGLSLDKPLPPFHHNQSYSPPSQNFNSPSAPNRRLRNIKWFPSDLSDDVLWACIDKHIIRVGKDNNLIIVPVDLDIA
ncbi:hypothetical protein H0H92_012378 [Tricholoma furcatifolium]|nr:hypothetical protein H0H92_012378 [Tricholoma furcatifolium]